MGTCHLHIVISRSNRAILAAFEAFGALFGPVWGATCDSDSVIVILFISHYTFYNM